MPFAVLWINLNSFLELGRRQLSLMECKDRQGTLSQRPAIPLKRLLASQNQGRYLQASNGNGLHPACFLQKPPRLRERSSGRFAVCIIHSGPEKDDPVLQISLQHLGITARLLLFVCLMKVERLNRNDK